MPCNRERHDGLYWIITYLTVKGLEEIVFAAFNTLIFSSIIFFLVAFKGSFLFYWLLQWIVSCTCIGANPKKLPARVLAPSSPA